MKSIIFAFTLFVAAVVAQTTTADFYFTSPIKGTTYEAGDTVTVKWINGLNQAVTVQLLTGTTSATMTPTGDNFSVDGSAGEYDWEVPTDLPQNATFSLMIQYVDSTGSSKESFSAAFTITGTTGDVVTQSFSTVSATTAASVSVSSASVTSSSALPSTTIVIPSTSLPASSSVAPSASASASASASQSAASSVKKVSLMAAGAMAIFGAVLLF